MTDFLPRLVGIIALSAGIISSAQGDASTVSPESFKAELIAALPPGAAQSDVVTYLDGHGIEHSAYGGGDRTINAIRRDVERRGLVSKSLRVDFHFDSSDRLTGMEVTEAFTGP